MMKTPSLLVDLSSKSPKRRRKVRNILSFSNHGHSALFLNEMDRVSFFHTQTCSNFNILRTMKLSSFSTYWAFYVYSYLSRFGMPYFWPIFFHNYSYSNFDVFWNMKLSSFSTQSGISCLLIFEWMRNALLFFWPLIFSF